MKNMPVRETIHLEQEQVLNQLPEQIGRVKLDYKYYPGRDLYSDGIIEDQMLDIVKNYSRVEFPRIIEEKNSWPILYHLSPLRGNILEWMPIDHDMKVLEIGSGCGAITETLSAKAGSVTCVDLSAKRSQVNAYRNQDRDNITIHVGNFKDIEPELPCDYDYACMIGVFEYGQGYMGSETPYEDFLNIMLKHVKNNGCVAIAIENKLGLKYFAGCKEDHLGTYFSGIENYPEGGGVRTFSNNGMEQILKNCGITHDQYAFYYPYPDYKFPTTIYSDRRLPKRGELTENIRNLDRDRMLLFQEKYAYDGLIQDGLYPLFSNSFLVVIGREPESVYVKYSNDRAEEYRIRTDLIEQKEQEGQKDQEVQEVREYEIAQADQQSRKIIRKTALSEAARKHILQLEQSYKLLQQRYQGSGLQINACQARTDGSYAQFPFERGVTLEELMDECLERDDLEGFQRLFERYLSYVSYGEESIFDYDLIFSNILVDGDQWTVIDYEWVKRDDITTTEIAFRAIYCYLLEEEKRNKLNLDSIIEILGITPEDAAEYRQKEAGFQRQVTGKRKSMGELRAAIGTYAVDPKLLMEQHLQEILDNRVQIYEDLGNGYEEASSYYIPDIYKDAHTIQFETEVSGDVRMLRIDPSDKLCMVQIRELLWNGMPVSVSRKLITSNGNELKNNCYLFKTEDPNLNLNVSMLEQKGMNTLSVTLEITELTAALAEAMAAAARNFFSH